MKHLFTIILILSLFLINTSLFGQAKKFNINSEDIESLIQSVGEMTKDSIYTKSKEWINQTFINSDAVIGSSIENQMIRFTGVQPNYYRASRYTFDLEFQIRIEFKENRYRLTVESLRNGNNGVFADINRGVCYKSDGEPRSSKQCRDLLIGIENTLNNLNLSIYNYLIGETEYSEEDW